MEQNEAVRLLEGLVAIRSHSHEEAAATRWLVDEMRAMGYPRAFVDEAGNAVGEIGSPDAAATVVLLGHIDTVPGNVPVRIESTASGDVLYGRGSVDAKGPLATLVVGARRAADAVVGGGLRVVVVGAVEEEAATSRGARYIAARFDGQNEPVPLACVIGEPSQWSRITLGYKGRLLLDVHASQPMAHTAGPDASVATAIVDRWNWVTSHAARVNEGRDKAFDQLSPSLRRFITATTPEMQETADAQFAWRIPPGYDARALVGELVSAAAAALDVTLPDGVQDENACRRTFTLAGPRLTLSLGFKGHELPWRADRQNLLVRSFLASIRAQHESAQPGFVVKTGTSDMNVVAPIWRCPIVAYGPGDSALDHTPHEHVSLDEYWRAVQVVEGMLRELAASLHSTPASRGRALTT